MQIVRISLGLLLIIHLGVIHVMSLNEEKILTITSFITQRHAVSAVIFACWDRIGILNLMKFSSTRGLQVVIFSPEYNNDVERLLKTSYYPVAVIVDVDCENSNQILSLASEKNLFSRLHHWLLLTESNFTREYLLVTTLESLYLPLDSHVTVAHQEPYQTQVLLQDVYHIAMNEPLTVTSTEDWTTGLEIPLRPQRTDYGGLDIPTVTVLAEGTWEDFKDFRYRHLNTDSKVQYTLMTHISEMLNFRMNVCLTDTWGYPINGSECFNGAVGLLQCGGCEIGATGLLFKTERMPVIDYAGETISFRGAFMFLKPSLSEVSVIYELPFNTSVWVTYTVTLALLTLALMFTRRVQHYLSPSSYKPVGFGETIMDTLAIVCQQDALHSPKNISSRIVFFFMLLLTVFLVTSYSAIIVSLLQTSSNAIKTLGDLMKSPLKLSMIDIFVNETTDPEVTRIFKEKLYIQPFKEAFTTEEVGMEKIRHGLYAFHGLAGSYKIISDTFEEHEKCRFKTCWLREVGLIDREDKRWFYQSPKCETAGQNFVSVRIQDFYPALLVLVYGIIGSAGLLIIEILYNKGTKFQCGSLDSTFSAAINSKD